MSPKINLLNKELKKPFLAGQLPETDRVGSGGLVHRDGTCFDHARPQRCLLAHKALGCIGISLLNFSAELGNPGLDVGRVQLGLVGQGAAA